MDLIKGQPIRVFDNQQLAALSYLAVDVRGFNAVNVALFVSGTTPSVDLTVKGSDAEGGNYLTLSDPAATRAGISASESFDVVVGTAFLKIDLANISGTFFKGQGFSVVVTPYVSPGQAQISISNTASQNLAQYGGATVGPSNPVDVNLQTVGDAALTLGQKAMGASVPVVLPSDQTVPVDTELPVPAALADGTTNPTAPLVGAALQAFNGSTWDRLRAAGTGADGHNTTDPSLKSLAMLHGFNGASWDRGRVPTVFKNIAAQAVTANTPVTVWTPNSGKKFRLLGWALSLSVAGSVILKDNTTEILRTPLMAAGVGLTSPVLGNGILSAAGNNTLKIDVSASGNVSGYVYGTEE